MSCKEKILQKLRGWWIVLKGRKIPYNKPLKDSASVCLLGAGSGFGLSRAGRTNGALPLSGSAAEV